MVNKNKKKIIMTIKRKIILSGIKYIYLDKNIQLQNKMMELVLSIKVCIKKIQNHKCQENIAYNTVF